MKTTFVKIAMLAGILSCTNGCIPEDIGNGNGITNKPLDASFTIVPIEGSPNKFILQANSTNYIMSKWDLGDGSPVFIGKMEQEIELPDAGSYTIVHYAVGKGGESESEEQDLVVATSDPNKGNIVEGGKLDTADDIDKWTVLTISESGTTWEFAGGKATVSGGGWNQQAFYQAINVIKDKTYKIDMICSSTSGVSNTWFEVYASPTAPVQNNDYSAGGKIRNINTWDGCGGSAFAGKISNIGCGTNPGTFTATATGVVYLVIKCGGEDLKDGISVDNIEVRGQ